MVAVGFGSRVNVRVRIRFRSCQGRSKYMVCLGLG